MNSSHGEKPTNVKNIQVDSFPAVGPYGAETSFPVIGSTPAPDPRQPAAVSWTAARPGPVLLPTAASQVKKRSIDPLRLARSFRRRALPATLLGTLLGTIAGVVTWFVVPPARYTATARLHVASVAPMFLYKPREAAPDYATFRQTQLALLKSQQVIDTALSQDEVKSLHAVRTKSDPTEWLQEQLSIGFSNGSEVLEIAMSGDDPKTVATLVNAVTAAYLQEVVNVDHEDRLKRLEGLKEIWKTYETNLRQKREQLRKIAQAVGSDDKTALTLQKQYEIDRQDLLRRNLIEVHAELLKRKAELQFADDRDQRSQENVKARVPVAVIEEELQKDPIITEHEETIGLLKQEVMKNSRAMRKPGTDPSIEAIWSKIRTEEIALKQRRKKLRALLEAQLRDGPVRGETGSLRSLGDQVAMLEQLESQYKGDSRASKRKPGNLTTRASTSGSSKPRSNWTRRLPGKLGTKFATWNWSSTKRDRESRPSKRPRCPTRRTITSNSR